MEKSKGHVAWLAGNRELIEASGEWYIAPLDCPIMTDGRRPGRWECSEAHGRRYWDAIYKGLVVESP